MGQSRQQLMAWGAGLLLGLLGLSGLSWADVDVDQDLQFWAPVSLEVPMGKLRPALEIQPRVVDRFSNLDVVRIRPSLTWDVNPNLALTVGGFISPDFPTEAIDPAETRWESRVWQQATWSHRLRSGRMTHQGRLEQRFLPNTSEVGVRGRYLLRLVIPTRRPGWSTVVSQELLVNLNDAPGAAQGFNQARWFVGLRRAWRQGVTMEGGYLLQLINQPSPALNDLNHVVLLRVTYTAPNLLKPRADASAPAAPPREGPSLSPIILD